MLIFVQHHTSISSLITFRSTTYLNWQIWTGKLSPRQHQLLSRRPQLRAALENGGGGPGGGGAGRSLRRLLPSRRAPALALLAATLRPDPSRRPPCRELLRHVYFTHDGFADNFPSELRRRAQQEAQVIFFNLYFLFVTLFIIISNINYRHLLCAGFYLIWFVRWLSMTHC